MKKEVLRLFCIAFLVASLCCVMVWPGHSMTLFRAECEIFSKGWRSMMHPLVAFPLIGQLFLLYMLWRPKRRVILVAAVLLSLLPAVLMAIGLLSGNVLMIMSAFPYLAILVIFVIRYIVTARNSPQCGH